MDKIKDVILNSNEGYELKGFDGTSILTGLASYNFKLIYRNDDIAKFECITESLPACKKGTIVIVDRWGNNYDEEKK